MSEQAPREIPDEMRDVVGEGPADIVNLWASHHDGDFMAPAEGTQSSDQSESEG